MEDPKTDRVLGVTERCMLCFSVDRTLSTVDDGVSHALGLTVALSPERRLRACWECGATLVRLHRFEQRAVQALQLLKPVPAAAKFECLSQLSHSSTIVVDNDNKSHGQTRTEEDQRSVNSSPAVDDFIGCEINDQIKIEINEDFETLPQCAEWINSVDLKNDITIGKKIGADKSLKEYFSDDTAHSVKKHSCEVSLDEVNCDDTKHNLPYNDVKFSDGKVDCEEHEMENLTQSINKVERDKEKSVTPVKEAKEIKEEDNNQISSKYTDNPPELAHLNKENKLEKKYVNKAQVLKCLSRLSRSSILITDFNKQYFGETLPLASPSTVDNLIGCEITDETNININENLPQCSPWFNSRNEITMKTEMEAHKALKEYSPVDTAGGVQNTSLKENFIDVYDDLTNPIISEDHEKASDIKVDCEKYDDKKKSFMQHNEQRLRETCVTTAKEVIKVTKEDKNPIRLRGSANFDPPNLLSLIEEGKLEKFICNDEQMLQAREQLKKMFPSMMRCRACLERFPGKETLRVHILERHTEVSAMYPVSCDVCTLRLPSPASLAEHRAAHYRLYRCLDAAHAGCDFVTASVELALTHARPSPLRKVLRCPECSRPYLTKSSLAKHVLTHNPDMPKRPKRRAVRTVYRCPRCEHRCPRKQDMLAHMAGHARNDPAAYCAPCGRQFKSRTIYRAHLRGSLKHVRKEDLEFGCDQCKQRFSTRTAARRHADTVHRNLNIHKCRHCDSRFRGHGTLKRHVLKEHLGVMPVKDKVCDVCDRAFLTNNHLSRHKLIHTGERPYKCDICGAAFAQPATLQTHRRGMHLGMKRTREGWVRRDAPIADASVASDVVAKTPHPDTTRRTRSSGRTRATSVAPNSSRPPCYKDTTTSEESERDE